MSALIVVLLLVIVVELGFLIYFIGGGGGLPWMVQAKNGLLSGRIASPRHHRTLAAKVEYLMCATRFQVELEQQRFRAAQGLGEEAGELDFSASPADLGG